MTTRDSSPHDSPHDVDDTSSTTLPDEQPGALIGPYRLVEPLGMGGFGSVWVADQEQPVRRRVALKLIKAGMDSADVLARFDAEQQALAVMDHPGIAKVLGAGVTPTGRPYFVMELVDGVPLTTYAERAQLGLTARLKLFQAVCHAVQHAHQKGIVHRDLKPDNVLVADDDGRPVPRVIDFGIAKALQEPLTEQSLVTGAHQIMGTPAYMAPEQAQRSRDVDTRADVYSLGAMLYELLTGARTFDFKKGSTTLEGLLRQIIEVDPPRPSQRVVADDDTSTTVAAACDMTRVRLGRALRGDLDWIVMRALSKERNRRYETVAALADDIARHLALEPIVAGAPSRLYHLRKLVRRNRGIAAGTVLAALALVTTLVVLAWSNRVVTEERDAAELARGAEVEARAAAEAAERLADERRVRAEDSLEAAQEVSNYLSDMLSAARPDEVGRDVTVRELLDYSAPTLGARFGSRPQVESSLRRTVGAAYLELGVPADAREQLERAIELNTELHGADHPETLVVRQTLARAELAMSDLDAAMATMEHVRDALVEQLGPDDPRSISALNTLAVAWQDVGRTDDAARAFREIYAWYTEHLGAEHLDTIMARHNLALIDSQQGRWDEAEEHLRFCLDVQTRASGERHPVTLSHLNDLVALLYRRGDYRDGLPLAKQLVERRRDVLGEEHNETLSSLHNLASLHWKLGEIREAWAIVSAAEPVARRVLGDRAKATLNAIDLMGTLLQDVEQYDEAEPLVREAYEGRLETLGPDHALTLVSLTNMVTLAESRGDIAQATELCTELIARSEAVHGARHERTLNARHIEANLARLHGDTAHAEQLFRSLHAAAIDALGPDNVRTVNIEADLAWTLLDVEEYDEAEEFLHRVHERRTESLGADNTATINALHGLARAYRDSGRDAEHVAITGLLFKHQQRIASQPDATPFDVNMLAWYYCDGPDPKLHDPALALEWAERANEMTGYEAPMYLDTLSQAREANEDFEGAVEAHERALGVLERGHPMREYHEDEVRRLRKLAGLSSVVP